MEKAKGNLKIVFLVFIVIEIILVVLSAGFKQRLEIGFESGKFLLRNVEAHYDLQDRITENFQRDEYLIQSTHIKLHHIENFDGFISHLSGDDAVLGHIYSLFSEKLRQAIDDNETSWIPELKNQLLNELNKNAISSTGFRKPLYKQLIPNNTPEERYLLSIYDKPAAEISTLSNSRLNRIIIESVFPETILQRQKNEPRIYGSFGIYNFFRSIFGEASALGAFYLIRMLFIIDLIFLLLILLIRRAMSTKPSKGQLIFEMIYGTFEDFVRETLGKDKIHFTPYITTIFLFIWISNLIGIIPVPGFMEPTRNINVPLGLGIVVVLVVHFTAVKVKGVWGHFQNYLNPIKNPLAVLDIVSEFSKVISISFRLFGNILGGAIIIVVVSSLINFIVFPVGLNLFFGIFVGSVQAFVFTMLALTYIGVEIAE
jgi:F-type H+-transporting ATPase subunit a